MAPGGGGSPPPPGPGGPPEDKSDEGLDEEENEEDDTDEETVSVTASSQASASKAGLWMWDRVKETYWESTGGPPEDPNDPTGGGGTGGSHRGLRGHRGKRGWTGPPGKDGAIGPMGPVGPRGFPGRGSLSTTVWPPYFYRFRRSTSVQCESKHYWNGELPTLSGRIIKSCHAIPRKCESKYGRTPKHDREESGIAGSSLGTTN